MPIKAVLFDIGETLWHSPAAPPREQFRRLSAQRVGAALAGLGCPDADAADLARGIWKGIEDAIRGARDGSLQEADYVGVAQAGLAAAGMHVDRTAAAVLLDATYVSGAEGGKVAFPDARPTLDALRARGFLLATVTNRAFGGPRFRQDLAAAGLDIGWDGHSVSVEVGYLKPHPAIFEHALAGLGVRVEEALMVGNSLREDVAGAQRLGIAAAWMRSVPDSEGVHPDFVIERVADLLDLPLLGSAG